MFDENFYAKLEREDRSREVDEQYEEEREVAQAEAHRDWVANIY